MRILGCVVNAQLKQIIHRNSLLIIPECPRMFGLGRQMRCIALDKWLGLHANRIGPASGGCPPLLQEWLQWRRAERSDRTGSSYPEANWVRKRGMRGVSWGISERVPMGSQRRRGSKGFGSRQGGEKVGNVCIVVGRDVSVSLSARRNDEYECLRP
ncbi:hypothetical protein B0H14DRAFT_2761690, partial [Mycena olivaceomarginata]